MVKTLHPLGPISSRIELAPGVRVPVERHASEEFAAEDSAPVADPEAAALRALAEPLDYPPLAQCTVPGDRLAIAIDETVPEAASILRGVLASAAAAGIEPDAIAVVAADEAFCGVLRQELGATVHVVVHDPDDPEQLCLVGLNEKSERLLVNRTVFEADIVLPIGCARLPAAAGSGVYDSLFPRLSDAETIGRMRTPSQRETAKRLDAARRRADEAGWMLGAQLVMQVVPAPDGGIAEVVAGDSQAVADHCRGTCERLWSLSVPHRASLVIATLTGGPAEQSWDNVARALAAIEPLVEDGGAVAICSDLETAPGRSLGQLKGRTDFSGVERDVRNDHSDDSWPAWQLARALQRGPVYFLSQLEDEAVEEMGLAPIADIDELERLAGHHESCIVIDDSQYAMATVANET